MPSIRPTLGQAATGNNFFDRPREIRRIWNALEAGSHVLIAAPRRVGKTSILLRLVDQPRPGFICLYVITQSSDSQSDFFKRLLKAVIEDQRINEKISTAYKASNVFKNIIGNFKGFGLAGTSLQFQDAADVDYEDEFTRLIKSLPADMPKIVLLIDEFPDALLNIEKDHSLGTAIKFLQRCRELRQDALFNQKVQFVYTGSVGLENIVSRMGSPQHINDLLAVEIGQLTLEEAVTFIDAIEKPFTLNEESMDALMLKIGWRIPFHFQVAIHAIKTLWEDEQPDAVIDTDFIARAFDDLVRQRNYFEFWQSRLKISFPQDSCSFAENLLSRLSLSQESIISSEEMNALAAERQLDDEQRRYVIRTLIHDGYINDVNTPGTYRFNSPLLRLWWQRNVASL